jgi:hypothetical protein
LGETVPERDAVAIATALERVLYDEQVAARCRENVVRVREDFTWDRALAPLIEFCRRADRAADSRPGSRAPAIAKPPNGRLARNLYCAKVRFRAGGARAVVEHGLAKARRLASAADQHPPSGVHRDLPRITVAAGRRRPAASALECGTLLPRQCPATTCRS